MLQIYRLYPLETTGKKLCHITKGYCHCRCDDRSAPVRNNTYIQSEGISQDFGIYDCPDDLLKEHHQEMSVFKAFLYRNLGRHLMNRNIREIRNAD